MGKIDTKTRCARGREMKNSESSREKKKLLGTYRCRDVLSSRARARDVERCARARWPDANGRPREFLANFAISRVYYTDTVLPRRELIRAIHARRNTPGARVRRAIRYCVYCTRAERFIGRKKPVNIREQFFLIISYLIIHTKTRSDRYNALPTSV